MFDSQFYATAQTPSHPSHFIITLNFKKKIKTLPSLRIQPPILTNIFEATLHMGAGYG